MAAPSPLIGWRPCRPPKPPPTILSNLISCLVPHLCTSAPLSARRHTPDPRSTPTQAQPARLNARTDVNILLCHALAIPAPLKPSCWHLPNITLLPLGPARSFERLPSSPRPRVTRPATPLVAQSTKLENQRRLSAIPLHLISGFYGQQSSASPCTAHINRRVDTSVLRQDGGSRLKRDHVVTCKLCFN